MGPSLHNLKMFLKHVRWWQETYECVTYCQEFTESTRYIYCNLIDRKTVPFCTVYLMQILLWHYGRHDFCCSYVILFRCFGNASGKDRDEDKQMIWCNLHPQKTACCLYWNYTRVPQGCIKYSFYLDLYLSHIYLVIFHDEINGEVKNQLHGYL